MTDKFVKSLVDYKQRCDSFIDGNEAREFLSSFGLDNEMGSYIDKLLVHTSGGKRIRAYLTALGYGLFCGIEKMYDVLVPSLSYELFQTGILAHDDIIDNSDYRRHLPSMHKALGQGHDGISKAICVGDFGIVAAIEILAHSGFDNDVVLRAVSHQNKVFSATIAGELKDIEFSYAKSVSLSDVLDMYRLKTAQYTVSGPLVLGAILAGSDEKSKILLSHFGDAVGISFQIKDDILGIFADEKALGKSILSDMREGKKTVLVSYFDEHADSNMKNEFYKHYGKPDGTEQDLDCVRQILKDSSSLAFAEGLCREYTDKAADILKELAFSDEKNELLVGLLQYMTSRTY